MCLRLWGWTAVLTAGLTVPVVRAQDAGMERDAAPAGGTSRAIDPTAETDLIENAPGGEDPLGIGATVDLENVPEPSAEQGRDGGVPLDPNFGPPPPEVPVKRGKVLHAIPGVREVDHDVRVQLQHGLARVAVTMRLTSRADYPAEIRYRLAVPPGAVPSSLEVCSGDPCRTGVADRSPQGESAYADAVRARGPDKAAPVAHVRAVRDGRGHALRVRAAPVPPEGELIVRVGYLARAPLHGGVVRLQIPGRGTDPRAAPSALRVTSPDLLAPSVQRTPADDTAVTLDPWREARVVAKVPTARKPQATAWRVRCGEGHCGRVRVSAGPQRGPPVDLILLLDVSPSMEGPPRNRIGKTLRALLASAPDGSRVRVLAFAGEAEALITQPTRPDRVDLQPLLDATGKDLGSATRLQAAWPMAKKWLEESAAGELEPSLVVVGDGGLTRGAQTTEAFEQASERGAPLSVVNVADRSTWAPLRKGAERTGGLVVEAGQPAGDAVHGHSPAALEERVAALFAPVLAEQVRIRVGKGRVTLGPLRAGEELVWEGAISRRRVRVAWDGGVTSAEPAPDPLAQGLGVRLAKRTGHEDPRAQLAAVAPADFDAAGQGGPDDACDPRGPAERQSGISSVEQPVAVVRRDRCSAPPAPEGDGDSDSQRGVGIPAHTVKTMVRNRVIPIARRCFRRDRRGRPDYSVRAVYHFRLADQEVVQAEVRGDLDPELRQCLRKAVDTLDVPIFTGVVDVTYPLYTKEADEPEGTKLEPSVAREVDALFGTHDPVPPDPDADGPR